MENPPIKVAFVIDGKVVDVLHTDVRLASIFLSEPLVRDVSEIYANGGVSINMTNWDWDGENFSYPASSAIGSPTEAEILAEDLAIEEADKQL
jgi:hypothetical protein